MAGLLEPAVGRPAIALQHPTKVLAQDQLGVAVAAAGDQIRQPKSWGGNRSWAGARNQLARRAGAAPRDYTVT